MFAGIFLIAVVQGLAMGVFFWLARLPYTPLWTLVAIVAATLPLGASVVALPAAIAQFLGGNYGSGIVILVGYFLVVSKFRSAHSLQAGIAPNVWEFCPYALEPLGWIPTLWAFWRLLWPILMVLFLTMLDVYQTRFASHNEDGPGEIG